MKIRDTEVKPKGAVAARLRQRKYELLERFPGLPADALPWTLTQNYRRCGSKACRCAKGEKLHANWLLRFRLNGKSYVEYVPADWAETVRPFVEQAAEFKDALTELVALNAKLLGLWRHERRGRRK